MKPLIGVESLSIIPSNISRAPIIDDFSFSINEGECVVFSGPSGIGKTLSSLSLLGMLPSYKFLGISGRMKYGGKAYYFNEPRSFIPLRGKEISLVLQEAQGALNPTRTCGKQLLDVIMTHHESSLQEAKSLALNWLERVYIKDVKRIFDSYPHQLSGGQKQRILICMAFICPSKLVIFDEPTASLDAISSAVISEIIEELREKENRSFLIITHDHKLIKLAQRSYEFVSSSNIVEVKNPAFRKSIIAHPDITKKANRKDSQIPIIKINKLFFQYKLFNSKQFLPVLNNISMSIHSGEAIAIIGKSGSGKSTLAKILMKILHPTSGNISIEGQDIYDELWSKNKLFQRSVQMIFQDPGTTLSPRMQIKEHLLELINNFGLNSDSDTVIIEQLLNDFQLSKDLLLKYPHGLSGGQRQRVLLAKVLSIKPKILICDESFVSLDYELKKQIFSIFHKLKNKRICLIFITHSIDLISELCDRIIVLKNGFLEENTEVKQFFKKPRSEEGQALLNRMN